MTEQQLYTITDFSNFADQKWHIVNDGVMGGLSQSHFQILANNHALFSGTVSLQNNGGFASAKNHHSLNLDGYRKILISHKGDGKRYSFRFRTQNNNQLNNWVYEHRFDTSENILTTSELYLNSFVPVYRGRKVTDAPPPDLSAIKEYGFLISDQQPGDFRLEIASITAAV